MMKNIFYFTSKALFALKIFKFLSWLFGHVVKWLDKKDKVNFKFYDIAAWLTNSCDTRIAQMLRSKGNQTKKLIKTKNDTQNVLEKLAPDPFLKN